MDKNQLKTKKQEISIFQTTLPRTVSTRTQLFLTVLSFVSSLVLVIAMADGSKIELNNYLIKCPEKNFKADQNSQL